VETDRASGLACIQPLDQGRSAPASSKGRCAIGSGWSGAFSGEVRRDLRVGGRKRAAEDPFTGETCARQMTVRPARRERAWPMRVRVRLVLPTMLSACGTRRWRLRQCPDSRGPISVWKLVISPTRLVTRTKEFSVCASHWVRNPEAQ